MLASFEHPENALSPIVVTLFGIVRDVKEEHPENASFPIVVTLSGIVMVTKEAHPENALSLIVVISLETLTVVSCVLIVLGVIFISPVPVNVNDVIEHPANALFPIIVTAFGIVRDVKAAHPENALSPTSLSDADILTDDNCVHPANASFPMVVTFGKVRDIKEEH